MRGRGLCRLAASVVLLGVGAVGCDAILGIGDPSLIPDASPVASSTLSSTSSSETSSTSSSTSARSATASDATADGSTGVDGSATHDVGGDDAPADGADASAVDQTSTPTTGDGGLEATLDATGDGDLDAPSGAAIDSSAEAGCEAGAQRCDGPSRETCESNGAWGSATIEAGVCGAACEPGTYQCGVAEIGQVCNAVGSWISNGSADVCECSTPGRFTSVSDALVLDTSTGVMWDRTMRAADTWINASSICAGAGLELPTLSQWQGVIISSQSAQTCNPAEINPAPFDQAAMPTTLADLDCADSICNLWSSQEEGGFPGYVFVFQLFQPNVPTGTWVSGSSDDSDTGIDHPYRCVAP
jgi:hypothetical protein